MLLKLVLAVVRAREVGTLIPCRENEKFRDEGPAEGGARGASHSLVDAQGRVRLCRPSLN